MCVCVQVSPSSEATDSAFSFACAGGDGVVHLWSVALTPTAKSESRDEQEEGSQYHLCSLSLG